MVGFHLTDAARKPAHVGSDRGHVPRSVRPGRSPCFRQTGMKEPPLRLTQRYVAGLRKHVRQNSQSSLATAVKLGRQSLSIGLTTLNLPVSTHRLWPCYSLRENFLAPLQAIPNGQQVFIAQANSPIEERHRATGRTDADFIRLKPRWGCAPRNLPSPTASCSRESRGARPGGK